MRFDAVSADARAIEKLSFILGDDPLRFGIEACRPTLEIIIDYCVRQKLIPRKITVDSLFDDVTRVLAP